MQDLFGENWWYETSHDNSARYVLGERGPNPLICMGVNPSTAEPGKLDNTLRNVKAWSKRLGFDGWMMLNLYPQRATKPNDLHAESQSYIFRANLRWIDRYLGCSYIHQRTIWAAWGTLIGKRRYLCESLKCIATGYHSKHKWISVGKLSQAGHPHHPLYLSKKAKAQEFDIKKYLQEYL